MSKFLNKVLERYRLSGDLQITADIIKPKSLKQKAYSLKQRAWSLKYKSGRLVNKKDEPNSKEAAGKVSFANLTNTRKLVPYISNQLNLTDPFYFNNNTWTTFLKNVAPKLLTALMLDMGILHINKKMEFIRHLNKSIKFLGNGR